MAYSTRACASRSRRALLIGGAVALVGGVLPGRSIAQVGFVLPSDSANRRFGIFYKGDRVGAHTVSNSPETGQTRDRHRREGPVLHDVLVQP